MTPRSSPVSPTRNRRSGTVGRNGIREIVFMLLAALGGAAHGAPVMEWFQVEILVFAQTGQIRAEEDWSMARRAYPESMVAIAPATSEEIMPLNIEQLDQMLRAYQLLEFDGAGRTSTVQPRETFAFEARDRDDERLRQSSFDRQDLMSGIVLEGEQPEATGAGQAEVEDAVALTDAELMALFEEQGLTAFRAVDPSRHALDSIATRLRRSSNYRVILHQAWQHPLSPGVAPMPVLVQGGDRFGDVSELDGTVTLTLSRYLHIDTDLWYTTFVALGAERAALNLPSIAGRDEIRDRYAPVISAATREAGHIPDVTYSLRQSRRMRSSELHYIDHPAFGLLVQVDRVSNID